jgi:hypothetical protein
MRSRATLRDSQKSVAAANVELVVNMIFSWDNGCVYFESSYRRGAKLRHNFWMEISLAS